MLRLFVAVTLPDEVLEACARERARIERALGTLSRSLRFPRPQGLHFTIKFLGWVPEELLPAISLGIEHAAARLGPFPVSLEGLEAFPNVRRPRVVYLGVSEGEEPMRRLASLVERELEPLGFPTERRPFAAHVTLARVKNPRAASLIGTGIAALEPLPVARFEVRKVSLMQSELSPGGSKYTELAAPSLSLASAASPTPAGPSA